MSHDINAMLGKTLVSVEKNADDTELVFTTNEGEQYKLYHSQDCCETVFIESIVGDLADLVDEPLLLAEEVDNKEFEGVNLHDSESFTWTFYKFATRKGYVDIRWYGSSNGYYGEGVDFTKIQGGYYEP